MHGLPNLKITLHVSDGLSVHRQQFKAIHTASGICHTISLTACQRARSGTTFHLVPASMQSTNLLYVFFWVILRRLNFICRRFGTLCLFHLHRKVDKSLFTYLPMKMKQTECFETSAYEIQTPGNYPEENIQHTEHGESLKSRVNELV